MAEHPPVERGLGDRRVRAVGALSQSAEVVAIEQVGDALFPSHDQQMWVPGDAHTVRQRHRAARPQIQVPRGQDVLIEGREPISDGDRAVRLLVEAEHGVSVGGRPVARRDEQAAAAVGHQTGS